MQGTMIQGHMAMKRHVTSSWESNRPLMKPQRTVDYGWYFLIYLGETFICINGVLKNAFLKKRVFNAEKC